MSDTELVTTDTSPQKLIPLVNSLLVKLQTFDASLSESVYTNFKRRLNELEDLLSAGTENKEQENTTGDTGDAKGSTNGDLGGYVHSATPLSPSKRNGKYVFLEELEESSKKRIIPLRDFSINSEPGHDPHAYDLDTYFSLSKKDIWRARLPWLLGLLLLQSFSATILGAFEDILNKHLIIAFFIPMLVGSGGNAGNQPGVMVTRALATGTLRGEALIRLLRKELILSLLNASAIGLTGYLRVLVQEYPSTLEAFAIGMSLWIVVFVSIFLGIFFSLILDRIGIDPAAGSAPLLTTISDLVGISILCFVATLVLY